MKQQKFFTIYALLGIVVCLLAWFNCVEASIILRWASLALICFISYKELKEDSYCYCLGALFAGVGETFTVLGYEDYPKQVLIPYLFYFWIMFYMVKKPSKDTHTINFRENTFFIIFITIFISYILYTVLKIISPELGSLKYLTILCASNYSFVFLYMGFMYVTKNSMRHIFLLFLMIAYIISSATVAIEAYGYPSKVLRQVIYAFEMTSHFLLLMFMITPDKKKNLF